MLRVVVIGPDKPIYSEAAAGEAITPGHVVSIRQAGDNVEAIKNTRTEVTVPMMVAVENDIFGKGIDDAYAVGDTVIYQHLRAGCEFMATVPVGAPAIAFDDPLTPDASGNLVKGTEATAVARARTVVDNSGGTTPARVRALVL